MASLIAQLVKNLPAMQETWVQFLGWEDPLEKEMATHSSILAWRIPWTEEPGKLQSIGSQESDKSSQLKRENVRLNPPSPCPQQQRRRFSVVHCCDVSINQCFFTLDNWIKASRTAKDRLHCKG